MCNKLNAVLAQYLFSNDTVLDPVLDPSNLQPLMHPGALSTR